MKNTVSSGISIEPQMQLAENCCKELLGFAIPTLYNTLLHTYTLNTNYTRFQKANETLHY